MTEQIESRVAGSGASEDSEAAIGLRRVQVALAGLRFGEVRVVVQDGAIVQVERTERIRIEKLHRRG